MSYSPDTDLYTDEKKQQQTDGHGETKIPSPTP